MTDIIQGIMATAQLRKFFQGAPGMNIWEDIIWDNKTETIRVHIPKSIYTGCSEIMTKFVYLVDCNIEFDIYEDNNND